MIHQARACFDCCHTGLTQEAVVGTAETFFVVSASQKDLKAKSLWLRSVNNANCVCKVSLVSKGGTVTDLITASLSGACYNTTFTILSTASLLVSEYLQFTLVSVGAVVPIGLTMSFECG